MNAKLLLMQTGDVPESGGKIADNFDQMFLRMADYTGIDLKINRVFENDFPDAPEAYAGVIVTGSPAFVTERLEWSEKSGEWLVSAIEANVPVLAVCYGHQLLAQAMGGVVDFHPKGKELGTHQVKLNEEGAEHPLLSGLPHTFQANLSHSQSVITPPSRAKVLAASVHDPHQILSYRDNALSLQFHPEFDADIMNGYVAKETGPGAPRQAIRLGIPVRETPLAASILQRFVDHCRNR